MADPATYSGVTPEEIMGCCVHIRPYYNVPTSRVRMESRRAAWTFKARIVGTFFEMVIVEFQDKGPWRERSIHYPREIHRSGCRCDACCGDGINELHGP